MHISHRDKKYRIKFLKDSNTHQSSPKSTHYSSANNQKLLLMSPKNTESLFDADFSTDHGLSTESKTLNIQRESES